MPQYADFKEVPAEEQELWADKTTYQRKDGTSAAEFYERAGIWAEFGKIVCISVGYFTHREKQREFRVTSFQGTEKSILSEFKILLDKHFSSPKHLLCAHNGKEFDFPYIARRMIINGLSIPDKLKLFGKKPWEVAHLDTLELWKFGDYKHYTSLRLMAYVLGIPSPKEDIDGSMVDHVYYVSRDLDRIIDYCERDVITTARVLLRLRNDVPLEDEAIKRVLP